MPPVQDRSHPSNTPVGPLARFVSAVDEFQEIGHRKLPRHPGRQFGTPVRPRRAERGRVVIEEANQHLPHDAASDLTQSVTVALDLGFFQDVVPEWGFPIPAH